MLDRLLTRFCAKEVQILLKRMEDRPEDFEESYTKINVWKHLVDTDQHYTRVERLLIIRANDKMKRTRGRRKILDRIMQETLNPTTTQEPEQKMYVPKWMTTQINGMSGSGGVGAQGSSGTLTVNPHQAILQNAASNYYP